MTPAEIKALNEAKARLASGACYPSADDYYADRNTVRELNALAAKKTAIEQDAMGFWFGMQSN